MVISRHHQHAALGRRAIGIAVFQRIAGPVHARPLAIPHGKYALDLAMRIQARLLRPQNRRCTQVFVDRRHKGDAVLGNPLAGAPQFQVQPPER